LGLVERRDFVVEWRFADGRYERLPDLAMELVRLKVDVIVAVTTLCVQAAHRATMTIPIVMIEVPDPIGEGFATSLSRPGGNITGLSNIVTEVSSKHLELFRVAVPPAVAGRRAHQPRQSQRRADPRANPGRRLHAPHQGTPDRSLMSYGQDLALHYERAAAYVDKILKGAKPGSLPIEQPTVLEFVINRKTARVLGLTVPRELELRADRIIE
jgi:putative ABC transport system substrate-binding protein